MTNEQQAQTPGQNNCPSHWGNCPVALMLLLVAILTGGCGSTEIQTASDIVAALEKEGIKYTTVEPADISQLKKVTIDEAVVMTHDSLHVEILRIERDKHFKIFAGMRVFLAVAEAQSGKTFAGRPDIFTSQPFIIIVRHEPEKGQVRAALKKIFPPNKAHK